MPDSKPSQPAGLIRRFAAMLYDAMIVLALWMITLFVAVAIHNGSVQGPLIQTILFFELFGFFAYFWVSRGQTVGMLAWGLRLESNDGRPIRLNQALLRFVGALLSFGTAGVGYLWIYVDPDRRSWSDMLSGTNVVHTPVARDSRR